MNNIFYIISYAFLILTIFFFVYRNFKIKSNYRILAQMHMQLLNDAHILDNRLTEVLKELNKYETEKNDGFIKFLSDSRDWAFTYIEEVQAALAEFDKEVSPVLEWCNTYGIAVQDVHSEQVKKISLAYDKLKEVLPKDNETPNN